MMLRSLAWTKNMMQMNLKWARKTMVVHTDTAPSCAPPSSSSWKAPTSKQNLAPDHFYLTKVLSRTYWTNNFQNSDLEALSVFDKSEFLCWQNNFNYIHGVVITCRHRKIEGSMNFLFQLIMMMICSTVSKWWKPIPIFKFWCHWKRKSKSFIQYINRWNADMNKYGRYCQIRSAKKFGKWKNV